MNARLFSLELAVDTILGDAEYVSGISCGFNGQQFRKQMFQDLMTLNPDIIVECGTFLGNTTGFMSEETRLPIYTSEIDKRVYRLARLRLKAFSGIEFHQSDSRQMLRELASSAAKDQFVFFYLDAHWFDDLPLRQEIEIIAETWQNFIVMIDDFEVPGDSGYGFDDYGPGKKLCLTTIEDILSNRGLVAFSPSCHSSTESGLKRGSCVVTPRSISTATSKLPSLRLVYGDM